MLPLLAELTFNRSNRIKLNAREWKCCTSESLERRGQTPSQTLCLIISLTMNRFVHFVIFRVKKTTSIYQVKANKFSYTDYLGLVILVIRFVYLVRCKDSVPLPQGACKYVVR